MPCRTKWSAQFKTAPYNLDFGLIKEYRQIVRWAGRQVGKNLGSPGGSPSRFPTSEISLWEGEAFAEPKAREGEAPAEPKSSANREVGNSASKNLAHHEVRPPT